VNPQNSDGLREQTRQQLLASLGGWSGTVVAAIPPVVFVIVNALTSLRPAIIAALASGVAVALYRLVRREPLQQAVTGLFSVAVAAAIAARTGQARGFFLLGIAAAIGYAAVFAVSLLIRRPLVGVLWEFLDPTPLPEGRHWRRVPALFRAYCIATGAVLLMFAARALVQLQLFQENRTGWLAVTKLVMGFPLYLAVVAVCFWVVRRARHRLGLTAATDDSATTDGDGPPAAGAEPSGPAGTAEPSREPGADRVESGRADGAADGRLGLGQRDE
jgi:hypothetical protein